MYATTKILPDRAVPAYKPLVSCEKLITRTITSPTEDVSLLLLLPLKTTKLLRVFLILGNKYQEVLINKLTYTLILKMMKTNMKLLIVFLSAALCFQSCSKDNLADAVLEQSENEDPVIEHLANGTLTIDAFLKDAISITTARALTLEEALDVMLVEITTADGLTTLISDSYRDLPATIELPAGTYAMLMSNFPLSDVRFDDGVYGDYVQNFEITIGNNTVLNPVLRLLDVVTTVNFSSEIVGAYPDISAYVARSGVPAAIFSEFPTPLIYEVSDDGRRGYHSLFSGNHVFGFTNHFGQLYVLISASNSAGERISVVRNINGMGGNKHFNINIEMTDATTASLDVTLEPEEENAETITFPN